ncbi:hypothetical protein L1987_70872 [Smallanthus sonchifolius]|uniref:Uncharacterized protein n=1 Tax=Smallanthus sonchifolius TaxID=185202 RepID=A0ACB9ARG0_9ASTR|nr:hypothetical protein L1987_70872 [Smallanthus sonchifolius]
MSQHKVNPKGKSLTTEAAGADSRRVGAERPLSLSPKNPCTNFDLRFLQIQHIIDSIQSILSILNLTKP